jgi:predicted RNA binding protein YcfA (HicA-like mRNA interferase family)
MLFAFHDRETVGPRMLSRILKDAGISADDLRAAL